MAGSIVFTGRSNDIDNFMTASGGNVAAQSSEPSSPATFRIGEWFIQNFKTGNIRFVNNFVSNPYAILSTFSKLWKRLNGGNRMAGAYVYGNKTVGEYEAYLVGSY